MSFAPSISSRSLSNVQPSSRSGGTMRQSSGKMRQLGVNLPQDAGERITQYLRQRYPHNTAKYVSADTKISAKTISKWLERTSAPRLEHFGALLYAYPAEFLSATFPGLSWVEAAVKLMHRDSLARQLDQADRELTDTFDMLRGRR